MTRKTKGLAAWEPTAAQSALVEHAAAAFGLAREDMYRPGARGSVARGLASQAAAWALKARWPTLSSEQIGKTMGRNHSTVLHNIGRAIDLRATDMAFHALTDTLAGGALLPPPPSLSLPKEAANGCLAALCGATFDDEAEAAPSPADSGVRAMRSVARGDAAFLAALRRAHPERMLAGRCNAPARERMTA